jgi:probable rRNA maturation factor
MPASGQRRRALQVTVVSEARALVRVPGLAAWLEGVAPRRARGIVTVAFVTNARMRQLNREFRGIDRPTDVLSFPASDEPARAGEPLGDIVIATGVAREQAAEAGHGMVAESRLLALHGLLHLMGYDHDTDGGEMARIERRLRRKGGLASGLIERAT